MDEAKKGKKPRGIPVKEGQVLNPYGMKGNPNLAPIRRLTHEELAQAGSYLLYADVDLLKQWRDDPTSPAFKAWICSIIVKGIESGNPLSLDLLLNRIVGKAPETKALENSPILQEVERLRKLSDAEVLQLTRQVALEAPEEEK